MLSPKANVSPRRSRADAPDWVVRARASREGPKYLAIAEALARAIETHELSPGDRLPAQREAARALGVDLTTVTRAYAQVRAMGLLDGETGRGTFVRAAGPTGPVVDLSMNMPPQPRDLSLRALMSEGVADLFRASDPGALMTYRGSVGARRDRLAGAAWLEPRLGIVSPERVLLASGAQSAIAALLTMLVRAGDVVLAEPYTYPGFIGAAKLLGVRLAAMACDEQGPVIAALEKQCAAVKPRALYLTPTLQNPTTRTMSEERRRALVALARKHDLTIIEDDAYGAFAPQMTPLARLAPERVFHVATLSKALTPGLRTAFVVAPEAMTERVSAALRATCMMPPPVLSDLAVRWIEGGVARDLFKAVRAESAARMKQARAILPARAQGGPEGFHLWLTLPEGWALADYLAAARARGVVLVGSDEFAAEAGGEAAVRVSLGAAAERKQLANGLKALTALERGPG